MGYSFDEILEASKPEELSGEVLDYWCEEFAVVRSAKNADTVRDLIEISNQKNREATVVFGEAYKLLDGGDEAGAVALFEHAFENEKAPFYRRQYRAGLDDVSKAT